MGGAALGPVPLVVAPGYCKEPRELVVFFCGPLHGRGGTFDRSPSPLIHTPGFEPVEGTVPQLCAADQAANPVHSAWIETASMAGLLGIHLKTLLRLRRQSFSPFREGVHYRRAGLTTLAPLQWHVQATEEAFTCFRRMPAGRVETFHQESATATPRSLRKG
jgi:hypothetical protein